MGRGEQKIITVAISIIFSVFIVLGLLNFINGHSSSGIRPSERMIKTYREQAPNRRKLQDAIVKETNHYGVVYNNLAPEAYCPELIKIGSTDDGGKWMCNPHDLPHDCVIFSLGMNNEISYETHIQTITEKRCRLFGFDMGEQRPEIHQALKEIRAQAQVAKISNVTNAATGEYTVSALMARNKVADIEILKIDAEGAELYSMEDFLKQHTVAQILIEVHGNPKETIDFLRMMGRMDYLLLHYEINGAHHNLSEYTFMHVSALTRYGVTFMARYLS